MLNIFRRKKDNRWWQIKVLIGTETFLLTFWDAENKRHREFLFRTKTAQKVCNVLSEDEAVIAAMMEVENDNQ